MVRSLHPRIVSFRSVEDRLEDVRNSLARSMVGCTVDLLADSKTIAHGVVSGVLMIAGAPKIVVDGRTYDMDQVLTSTTNSIP
jgi:hypothetical protein